MPDTRGDVRCTTPRGRTSLSGTRGIQSDIPSGLARRHTRDGAQWCGSRGRDWSYTGRHRVDDDAHWCAARWPSQQTRCFLLIRQFPREREVRLLRKVLRQMFQVVSGRQRHAAHPGLTATEDGQGHSEAGRPYYAQAANRLHGPQYPRLSRRPADFDATWQQAQDGMLVAPVRSVMIPIPLSVQPPVHIYRFSRIIIKEGIYGLPIA